MKIREILPLWRVERFLARQRARKALPITKEMLKYNLLAAQRHGVEPACHPRDFIYDYVIKHLSGTQTAVDYYFDDGARSAEKFADIVSKLAIHRQPIDVLEFASGYGCVTRHLKKNAALSLVACDIHKEATDFIQTKLGVPSRLSAHVPEEFSLEEKFDVVFALSFFSHMPKSTFGRWIKALFSQLRCPGYLIFTTHGLASLERSGNPEIPSDGIWFSEISEQGDLKITEYGTSIVTEDFVTRQVYEQTGEAIFDYQHAAWWDHQDLWIVKNTLDRARH